MNNQLATGTSEINLFEKEISTSGSKYEAGIKRSNKIVPILGIALSLSVMSPATAISDTWTDKTREKYTTVDIIYGKIITGRIISRAEALRLSRQILEEAEKERQIISQLEAKQGLPMEIYQ